MKKNLMLAFDICLASLWVGAQSRGYGNSYEGGG